MFGDIDSPLNVLIVCLFLQLCFSSSQCTSQSPVQCTGDRDVHCDVNYSQIIVFFCRSKYTTIAFSSLKVPQKCVGGVPQTHVAFRGGKMNGRDGKKNGWEGERGRLRKGREGEWRTLKGRKGERVWKREWREGKEKKEGKGKRKGTRKLNGSSPPWNPGSATTRITRKPATATQSARQYSCHKNVCPVPEALVNLSTL